MFPDWLIEFLHANPYPSLSFLPMPSQENPFKEEIVFFYQNEKSKLEKLSGTIKLNFTFIQEPKAYVMRVQFFPETITRVETQDYTQTEIKIDSHAVETEFSRKNKGHIEALRILEQQDNFALFLYDKKTNFMIPKRIGFAEGRKTLNQFIKLAKV